MDRVKRQSLQLEDSQRSNLGIVEKRRKNNPF
jgi:hypothetical protein